MCRRSGTHSIACRRCHGRRCLNVVHPEGGVPRVLPGVFSHENSPRDGGVPHRVRSQCDAAGSWKQPRATCGKQSPRQRRPRLAPVGGSHAPTCAGRQFTTASDGSVEMVRPASTQSGCRFWQPPAAVAGPCHHAWHRSPSSSMVATHRGRAGKTTERVANPMAERFQPVVRDHRLENLRTGGRRNSGACVRPLALLRPAGPSGHRRP